MIPPRTSIAVLTFGAMWCSTSVLVWPAQAECEPGWLGESEITGVSSTVAALAKWDDGSGLALYAGGAFETAGGVDVQHVAKWDGTTWSPLGPGFNDSVQTLVVFDDGSGAVLYAGGLFSHAGELEVSHVARWDGTSWSPLGSGMSGAVGGDVNVLAVYDDGNGAALYATGTFDTAGGVPANQIAKWDGEAWTPLGDGLQGGGFTFGDALTVYDDGSGPKLVVGGTFLYAGGAPAMRIAAWDGTSWSAFGTGMFGTGFVYVSALGVGDEIDGPALYASGSFTAAGGQPANNVARWDGTGWHPLGAGVSDRGYDFEVYTDGLQPVLYLGGAFTTAGDGPANHIAKWDGTQWTPLDGGVAGGTFANVQDLLLWQADELELIVGGYFTTADGAPADNIAKWRCNPPLGACCLDADCVPDVTEEHCEADLGGLFAGPESTCDDPTVCDLGACCDRADFACVDNVLLYDCLGPAEWSELIACADLDPPCLPTGACCDWSTSACQDDVYAADCFGPQQEWSELMACADLAPPCLPTGTCCDWSTLACQDDVYAADCFGPQQEWSELMACANLDPPCLPTGACCNWATYTCDDGVYEADCQGPDEEWSELVLCTELDPPCEAPTLVGDSNCDGSIDFFDIDCFIAAVTGGEAAWLDCSLLGECDFLVANDVNGDGLVNFFDIDPFVVCITSGGCP